MTHELMMPNNSFQPTDKSLRALSAAEAER
jgi:hypothetical protein